MNLTNFDTLRPTSVGFEELFRNLDRINNSYTRNTFPPYNLISTGEDEFLIELAVAGFSKDDIEIETHNNVLTVSGKSVTEDESNSRRYMYRGIAGRSFKREFLLGDYVEVENADIVNGILRIQLRRHVPESMKPKRIEISS